jgi:MFS family permease
MIGVPLLAALSFALAALARSPGYGFLTTPVALAGLGAALGLGSIYTITVPYPMDKRLGNATRGAAAGYTSYGAGSTLGTLLGVAVLVAPVIVAAVLTSTGPDTGARRLRRRLRPRAGLGRRADRSPRRRRKTAGTLPGRYSQPAIDNPDRYPWAQRRSSDIQGACSSTVRRVA